VPEERNSVIIDADGHLTVDSEAQRRLAGRPGRFRVVPTTGELIILQRVGWKPGERRDASHSVIVPGRVVLAGEVDAVGGLVDVINFIHVSHWSGQLALVDGLVRKTLYFRRGDIRSAASNVPEDRLGAILYRYGVVSEEQLDQAVKASTGMAKLGQTLVEQGSLTAHELYTYVRRQVEEIFWSVLSLRKGGFYFYRTADDDGPPSQLLLSTKALLFDGVRRIDELSYFREKLPSQDLVLVRKVPQPPERLPPREQRMLDLVDGARDLAALSQQSHLGEFETTKILYQLLQSGYVQPRPPGRIQIRRMRPGDAVDDLYAKIVESFNYVYAKIHAAVAARGKSAALQKGLESFFGSVAEFAPLFVGLTVNEDGTLQREQVLANLEMAPTDDRIDYLHRGLNELLFFELFTAGEAVDRREELELHQRLNQILRDVPAEDERAIRAAAASTPEVEPTDGAA
jgi:hypothetical protein